MSALSGKTTALLHLCERALHNTVSRLHLERVGVFVPSRGNILIQWQSGKLMLVLTVEGPAPYLDAAPYLEVWLTQSSGGMLRVDIGGYLWLNTKPSRRRPGNLQKVLELIDEQMDSIGIPVITSLQAVLEHVHVLSAERAMLYKKNRST